MWTAILQSPYLHQKGMVLNMPLADIPNCDVSRCATFFRKSIRRTMSGGLAGHTPPNPTPDSVPRTRVDTGATPDCPLPKDSDDISVTNSEVESATNHRCRRAAMRDPTFTEEAFNAFSSTDAYIRAARDGLAGATHQLSKDMRVSTFSAYSISIYQ